MLKTIKANRFQLNQSGVAHLLYPILGLAVVAVIAGAGFYVYQQNKSSAGTKVGTGVSATGNASKTTMVPIKLLIKQKNQSNRDVACSPTSLQVSATPPGKIKPQYLNPRGIVKTCDLIAPIASASIGYASRIEYQLKVPSSLKKFRFSVGNNSELVGISGSNGYKTFADSGRCFIESPVFTLRKPYNRVEVNTYAVDVNLHKASFPKCK